MHTHTQAHTQYLMTAESALLIRCFSLLTKGLEKDVVFSNPSGLIFHLLKPIYSSRKMKTLKGVI